MKILFISVNNETEPYPVAPLGAAYVASFLKGRGHSVSILDLCFVDDDMKAVESSLAGFNPDVIGISLRNIDNLTYNRSVYYLPRIKLIVNFLKSKSDASIIIGGSGYSIFPEGVLRYLELDTGIIGEGENAFATLVENINGGSNYGDIPNVCYLRDDEFSMNSIQHNAFDWMPDRSLLSNDTYLDIGGMANIQSKRGCPFHCSYCTYPNIDGNQLRLRSPEAVVEEICEMKSGYGIDYAFFVDDIFNFPENHAAAICEEILKRDLEINWTCFATPMGMTSQLAALMKRAGCEGIEFGSDAVTGTTLEGLGKQFTVDDVACATEACSEAGLPNAHYLIIGGPGENESTLNETFEFFDSVHPTAVIALAGLRIYPNTLLYNRAVEENIIEKNSDLLEPEFYLSPDLNSGNMIEQISEGAAKRKNWVVPALNIRYDMEMMKLFRKVGKRGSLWRML